MPFADLEALKALETLVAPAHGVGSRQDLPPPFEALLVGAALALLVSFLGLGLLWREPRLRAEDGRAVPPGIQALLDSARARVVAAGLSVLLFAVVLLALVAGKDDANNPVPYVVYVWLWVGMPVLSMLLGPLWPTLNPMRWLRRGLGRVARISSGFALTEARAGYWAAAVLLFLFTWLELVADDRTTQPVMRAAIGFFVLVSVAGSLLLGPVWFAHGDPFEVLSRLYGRLSVLGRRPDGRFVLRSPVHGPSLLEGDRGLLATTAVMLGGTAYDSLSGDIRYAGWVQSTAAPSVFRTLTLFGVCLVVAGALHLAAGLSAVVAGVSPRGVAAEFAPSLVPIAAGYLVAHYWSLLVYQGQHTLARLSDPLGIGADWLGTRGLTPNQALIAPTVVAVVQVGAIVFGHVLGVVVAHERALTLFPRRHAVAGQVPLMVLMVFYTVGGLSLLFTA